MYFTNCSGQLDITRSRENYIIINDWPVYEIERTEANSENAKFLFHPATYSLGSLMIWSKIKI